LARRFVRSRRILDPSPYVRISENGLIVIVVPRSEMGQGVRTSLAMLVAEEMDADWSRVNVLTAPLDARYGDQGTAGSVSVFESWTVLRRVGAIARAMLVAAAARKLGVGESELTTERS